MARSLKNAQAATVKKGGIRINTPEELIAFLKSEGLEVPQVQENQVEAPEKTEKDINKLQRRQQKIKAQLIPKSKTPNDLVPSERTFTKPKDEYEEKLLKNFTTGDDVLN
jgi:hypothetical protein